MPRLAVRSLVFRTLIALVVVNAIAGIAVIIASSGSQVGSTEGNILVTTGLLSLAALLFLPCVLAHEAGRPKPVTLLPSLAVSCLIIGFSLAVYLVWEDDADDTLTRIAWSFCIATAGLAHVCLLSLVRMRPNLVWLQVIAIAFTVAVSAALISAFWSDMDEGFDDGRWRTFTVLAILTAATSLLVPVVDRMTRARPGYGDPARRPSYCPNCGAVLHMDDPRCLACGVRFRVEFL